MATFVGTATRVLFGHLNLSGLANEVSTGDLTRAMQDCTTFNDGGYTCVKPGIATGNATIAGYQNWTTNSSEDRLADQIGVGQLGTQYPVTVVGNPTGGTGTAGDVAWFSRGVLAKYDPMGGTVGEMAKFMLEAAYDTAILRGVLGHAGGAVTATGSDSAIAYTGPTTSQKLYGALHVIAYTGLTAVTISVESDDNAGFSSAATRLTFTAVQGTGSEFASVAGYGATETYHRIKYTASGTGTVTFWAAFGVL